MAAKPPLEPNHAWLPLEARGWLRLWLGGGSSVSPGIFYSSASRAPRLTPRALPHARDALDAAPSFDRSTVATRGHESDVRRRDVVPRGRAPGEMPLLEEGVVERLYSQDARQRRRPARGETAPRRRRGVHGHGHGRARCARARNFDLSLFSRVERAMAIPRTTTDNKYPSTARRATRIPMPTSFPVLASDASPPIPPRARPPLTADLIAQQIEELKKQNARLKSDLGGVIAEREVKKKVNNLEFLEGKGALEGSTLGLGNAYVGTGDLREQFMEYEKVAAAKAKELAESAMRGPEAPVGTGVTPRPPPVFEKTEQPDVHRVRVLARSRRGPKPAASRTCAARSLASSSSAGTASWSCPRMYQLGQEGGRTLPRRVRHVLQHHGAGVLRRRCTRLASSTRSTTASTLSSSSTTSLRAHRRVCTATRTACTAITSSGSRCCRTRRAKPRS